MASPHLSRSAGILALFILVSLFGLNFKLEAQNDAGASGVHPRAAYPARPPAREKAEDSNKPPEETIVPFAVFSVTNTNDTGAGSLRQALTSAVASTGPHVIDAGGVTGTISLQSALPTITNTNITINGPTNGTLTITRGVGTAFRIFTVTNASGAATLTLNNLTMTNGNTGGADSGGGIRSDSSTLNLNYCTISGCVAENSGATKNGGGLFASGNGTTVNINFCTFTNNQSDSGGGISVGVGAATGTVTINNTTISGNQALTGNGGGLQVTSLTANLNNCTISGNTSALGGGGMIGGTASTVNLRNCTVTNNTGDTTNSGSLGGGVRALGSQTFSISNTIIAGNFQSNPPVANDITWSSAASNKTSTNSTVGILAAGQSFNTSTASFIGNPTTPVVVNLGALANNGGPTQTHALLVSSPERAINLGSNTLVTNLASDQRGTGFNRISGGTVDMGAVESGSTSPSFTGVTPLGAPAQITGVTTLSYTVPPGTNRLLVVTASNASNTAQASVSFAGTPMTLAIQRDDTFAYDSIFSLALGTSSTATSGNVVVTGFATAANTVLTAQTFQNVNQTTPIDGTGSNQATGTNLGSSVTINTTTAGDVVFDIFDCFVNSGAITSTPGAGQAAVNNTGLTIVTPGTGFGQYTTSAKPATGASTSTSWTSNTAAILHLAANINQATAGTTVSSINRVGGTSVCSGASVSWTVTFAASVSGLTTSNFALANTGLTSPTITGVSGSGTTWTVTASTGTGSGSLGLNMTNATGVTPTVTNLPFTGQVFTVNANPTVFNVTGGGTVCSGGPGVAVGLNGSQTGVNYQLFNGASPVGSPVAGTGSAISFGSQTTAGTYTVVATNGTTSCTSNMTGSAVVTLISLVVTTGSDSGAGSLRQTIADACAGSTITFQAGVTTVTLTTAELAINKNLTIDGGTGVTVTRQGGSPNFRIFNVQSGNTVSMNNLTVTNGNHPVQGGAIQNGGSLTLTNCAISGNTAPQAGGIENDNVLVMTGCTISGNVGTLFGGGLIIAGPTTTLTNCTISGNNGGSDSGGIGAAGTVSLTNCTITNNQVTSTGGGIVVNTANVTLRNTIVAQNTALVSANIDGTVNAASSNNLIGVGGTGGLTNGVNGNLVGVATPLLGVLGSNGGPTQTIALLPGSPAINAGTNTSAPSTDQRGVARPQQTTTDIGAFESRGFTMTLLSGNNQSAPVNTAFASPLAVTVSSAFSEPVNGGQVTFTPPGSGASATIAGNPATITSGTATTGTVTANATLGGPYTVAASANGVPTGVNFSLTNGCPTITAFNVTGGGSFCSGSGSVAVGLSGSQTGVNYQLFNGASPVGGPVAGTGSALNFGNQTTAGTYTVVGTFGVTGCTANMTGSAVVTVNANPTAFGVTGGGSFCSGGTGAGVGLTSSQTGVNYQLFRGGSPVGSPVAGTGSSLSFGSQTTPGTYTVVGTNGTTGCSANMTGSAVVTVNATPTAFNVTGGGSFCSGGTGVAVGLSGSQTGVNYQLFRGASAVGSPLPGTGAALNFGNQTTVGTYTVVATATTGSCTATMTGNAVVTVNANPTTFNVTGGGSFCSGGTGVAVGLSGSQTGVNYQLFNGASPVGSPVAGTGSALNFGNQTTAGTYTVTATNGTTSCTSNMTGSAVVTVNALPAIFNVTGGGGTSCVGGSGVAVGLSGSETGVNYQLFNGAAPVGSPVGGTGSALNFGNQTTAGTYTVVATNATTGCTSNMTGNAVVTVVSAPTAFNVTGGGSFCSGGGGVAVGLSGSETGVNYQLFRGASPVGSPVAGTGSALNFGIQTTGGTYTVVGTNTTAGCSTNMTGSAVVTVNPTPTTFSVTGGGSFCSGGSGVAVGLSGSQTGVNYQLFNGASPVGSPVAGTGSAISFGNQTTAGTYTAVATNATTGCTANMTGSATVTVNPTPTTFSVTGGGSFCSGGTGVAVGLSGSQTGVNYQLFNGASPVGSPVAGTGSALNFGNQTTAGTYTVVATNATTSCTANMTGSATVTVTNCSPTVTTNPATGVTTTGATLNGTVNANGDNTTVLFRYGTTAGGPYPNSIAATPSPVTGTTPTAITATVSGLLTNQVYYFIAEGTNGSGTTQGLEQSFSTAACTFSLSASSANFPASGGNGSVTITTTAGCAWNVSGIPTWISNVSPASGTGTTAITFTVAPNQSDVSRSATLTIGGESFTVNQDASVAINSLIGFSVVSQTAGPPSCSPTYANDYTLVVNVTNNSSQPIYTPYFQVVELQEAAGSPAPPVPFRLVSADGATCSTGGLVGSIQSTDGQTTPTTVPTLAPGQSVTIRFVIALPSLRRFRFVVSGGGSTTAPVSALQKGAKTNPVKFVSSETTEHSGGMAFLVVPSPDGKRFETIPVQPELEGFLNLGDDFWIGLNRTLFANGGNTNQPGSHR
jgi:hypothetical protein